MNKQPIKVISILSQLEQEIEQSPRPKLGPSNRRIIDNDLLRDLIGDIKATIPEDIRRAHSILSEADSMIERVQERVDDMLTAAQAQADEIIDDAQNQREQIIFDANREYEERVNSEAILQEATARAKDLVDRAQENANVLYNGSKQYADDILFDVQRYLGDYIAIIQKNREELGVRYEREEPREQIMEEPPSMQEPPAQPAQQPVGDLFDDEEQAEPAKKPKLFERAKKTRRRSAHELFFEDGTDFPNDDAQPQYSEEPERESYSAAPELDIDLDFKD